MSQGEFRKLEEMAQHFRDEKVRFADGTWKLTHFYGAMPMPPDGHSNKNWEAFLAAIETWNQAMPNSTTAKIAKAQANRGYGSYMRANKADVFRSRYGEALSILQSLDSGRDPAILSLAIQVLTPLPIENKKEVVRVIFERGIALFPDYLQTYLVYMLFLSPRSSGSTAEMFSVAAGAAEGSSEQKKAEAYATLMKGLVNATGPVVFEEEFADSMDWGKARMGFRLMESQYPDSCLNLNYFAVLASIAGDRETAAGLFEQLSDDWDERVWVDKRFYKRKRKWAMK